MSAGTVVAGVDVSRETLDRLEQFAALLVKWNPAINLVARSTIEDLWARHILDSVQLAPFLDRLPGTWLDLGSGGGLPGLVLAIVSNEVSPNTRFELVDSDQRKCTFLRQAARELELRNVCVHSVRIEELKPMSADVVSARALSNLSVLCGYAAKHLSSGGFAVFPKGAAYLDEVHEARNTWRFHIEEIESMTNKDARLLKLSAIEHV
ncbi:ribosomal RNA small subunit methyltransferase G [Gemmobacter aquaticus]|uniref:Ribosomal RNA small subunit methyltransferase G n=1 Tax=Gemmobacter aquaticus TaxID=490185 RepID=A0A917YKU9_9RHOB|nr:16S rRNA (guanine(527)-N(7))-methyltransferase RsmG [Gemmobacter aquaticus]GGO33394.1 ribosomal RNA small subunit methyltransferase G [Gemmobacter aquaticus]